MSLEKFARRPRSRKQSFIPGRLTPAFFKQLPVSVCMYSCLSHHHLLETTFGFVSNHLVSLSRPINMSAFSQVSAGVCSRATEPGGREDTDGE